jgi:hypothetical protein
MVPFGRPVPPPPADPWNVEAEAARAPQVVPFTPRVSEPVEGSVAQTNALALGPLTVGSPPGGVDREPAPVTTDSPARILALDPHTRDEARSQPADRVVLPGRRGWRINWRRTAAASLAVILLEGVAFATAWWFVKPSELGTLLVQTSQAGVEVMIDGRSSGVTPLSVQLKPGRYTLEMRGFGVTKVVPVEISAGVKTTQSVKWLRGLRLGKLKVTTTPGGARISVDGTYRGTAPLTLDDVPVGTHVVVAESPSGTVKNHVQIVENDLAELEVGIFSGWLTVFAPVEVRVFESGRLLGTSLDGRMLVAAGPHTLDLVNKRLGYHEKRTVEIEPGKHTALSVEVPDGTIVIEAPDGTEVTVDGTPVGTMPVDHVKAPIGTREVVLKHPSIGQRRVTVTVGADAPARVSLLAPQ